VNNRTGALILALLLGAGSPALAQDSDQDGVLDAADAFPCDGAIAAVTYAPSLGTWTMLLFEDQWPNYTDLDFNDVVVRAHYRVYADGQGAAASPRGAGPRPATHPALGTWTPAPRPGR
jgi:hypothetical protein